MTESIRPGFLRVTHLLSLFSGLSSIDSSVLENAAARGKLVHDTIEAERQGIGKGQVPEHIQGYMQSYDLWAEGKKFIPKPKRMYCDMLMITGEIDDIYQVGDELILVDYKTPARQSKTWPMQATAYKYLCKQYGLDIARIEFVKLEKTGKAPKEFFYIDDMPMFIKILESYRYFFENKDEENVLDYL
jgi:ATP-dependent exoDNAse (exonuclease V) beta subunit